MLSSFMAVHNMVRQRNALSIFRKTLKIRMKTILIWIESASELMMYDP